MRNPSLSDDATLRRMVAFRPVAEWHANILSDTLIYAAWLVTGKRHTRRADAIAAIEAHQQQMEAAQ